MPWPTQHPRPPRRPRRLRGFGLRGLGVVLTLCLAIMCTSAAVPPPAHANMIVDCKASMDAAYVAKQGRTVIDRMTGFLGGFWHGAKCQIGGLLTASHQVLFGAAELLWEGVYGAGCGGKNLLYWDGTACETSVADSGVKARNMLNDWADCIAAFDVFTPGNMLGVVIAWDSMDQQVRDYKALEAAGQLRSSVQSVAISGGTETVERFVKSPGVQDALADNASVRRALGKSIPGVSAALLGQAIASECFNETVRQLSAVVRVDSHLSNQCTAEQLNNMASFSGNQVDPVAEYANCEEWHLLNDYLTDANVKRCLAGEDIEIDPNLRRIEFEGELAVDLCDKVILPEARDRGLLDDDEMSVADVRAPVAPPAAAELTPAAVPGGSTAGSCGIVLRAIADGNGTSFSSTQRAECTGTSDATCQSYRARSAVGAAPAAANRTEALALRDRCM
jgi:hypothetical protein